MKQAVFEFTAECDLMRAKLLKVALRYQAIRSIFLKRANRLLVSFVCSAILQCLLSLLVPIWMLALGPLLFGFPHLWALIRYLPKFWSPENHRQSPEILMKSLCLILFSIGIFRVLQTQSSLRIYFPWMLNDTVEWLGFLLTCGCIVYLVHLESWMLIRGLFFLPLAFCAWKYPYFSASVLLIGHNFVAFYFWICATTSKEDRRAAILALSIFVIFNLLIIFGALDFVTQFFNLSAPSLGVSLEPVMLGRLILPGSVDFKLLDRAISVFAFGQAMHYFVWLKAIAETQIKQEVPLSFTQSLRSLRKDLGPRLIWLAAVICLGIPLAIGFSRIEWLRQFYLSIAAVHGYMEIASLQFLPMKKIS